MRLHALLGIVDHWVVSRHAHIVLHSSAKIHAATRVTAWRVASDHEASDDCLSGGYRDAHAATTIQVPFLGTFPTEDACRTTCEGQQNCTMCVKVLNVHHVH
jgi:hypothetical protein